MRTNDPTARSGCDDTIARHGLRLTDQRRSVYESILDRRDHPTAVEVFLRVKERVPSISLATVYNCLEALSGCGLVKHVTCERGPSRFCPNLEEHGHFFCGGCGAVLDVPFRKGDDLAGSWLIPRGAVVTHQEASFHGLCPECAAKPQPDGAVKRKIK